MELLYDANNPPVGVIGVDILDNGFSSMSFQPNYYVDNEMPGWGMFDALYLDPSERLYPFNDITSQIIYLWNNFNPDKREYLMGKFGDFYPRKNMFYDPNNEYDWDDLFRFWYMNGNYIEDGYLNDYAWRQQLFPLHKFMLEIADDKFKELVKKECCSNDKHLARAIWIEAISKVIDYTNATPIKLTPKEIKDIKSKFINLSSSTTDPSNDKIFKIPIKKVCNKMILVKEFKEIENIIEYLSNDPEKARAVKNFHNVKFPNEKII